MYSPLEEFAIYYRLGTLNFLLGKSQTFTANWSHMDVWKKRISLPPPLGLYMADWPFSSGNLLMTNLSPPIGLYMNRFGQNSRSQRFVAPWPHEVSVTFRPYSLSPPFGLYMTNRPFYNLFTTTWSVHEQI